MSQHPTIPPVNGDFITHFRRVITGNCGQTLTVEVVSLVDEGQATPPILTTHGNLDMSPDQAVQLADALTNARAAYAVALESWQESLR
ncbi:hypothetical protein [Dietzia cinnamea]|uniref:hypothetical protein n=1 Tax=Dietzia cinnamea TaxID=321318 RepID=UPI00223AF760|nr:hypothetical protein [Dietzia cinnamea]MCT2076302.1 hypothetical protein [Dietzia cinnamea]MCT2220811.1 hypothetical protein [Dietzia cinnamea]